MRDALEEIYEEISEETLKRVKREKATKLRRKTLKMIALIERLNKLLYR